MDELITVVRHPLGRRLTRQDGVARDGGMRKFRRCVREHVMSKIAWTEAPPSRWKDYHYAALEDFQGGAALESGVSRSIRDIGGLALICLSPSKTFRMVCELHGSTSTVLISTQPELGAAERVPWLPILDAESVAS